MIHPPSLGPEVVAPALRGWLGEAPARSLPASEAKVDQPAAAAFRID